MHPLIQWLGGGFYLLNKIFLWLSEHSRNLGKEKSAQSWRITSWVAYLIGLPFVVIILAYQHNWIAASLEAGGAPAMVLGLVRAILGKHRKTPRWLDYVAVLSIVVGFSYSLYDFGGLSTVNQWLEIGLVLGFYVGTYMLAKERLGGYLWYVLMHVCCGWLMLNQNYPWLFLQQLISLLFIVSAYITALRQEVVRK